MVIPLSHKKDETPSFVTTWMDLDSIMPSEVRQTKRTGIV